MMRLKGFVLCLVLGATIAACANTPDARHPLLPELGSEGWAGIRMPEWGADVPYPFVGAVNLCLDWPGTVEVTEVAMLHVEGGFRVDEYALRHSVVYSPEPTSFEYPEPETFTETLKELGFSLEAKTIDTVCPPELGGPTDEEATHLAVPVVRGVTELGVQFSKATERTARGAVLEVTYSSGDRTHTHRIGFEMILCEHAEQEDVAAECAFRERSWR